MIKIRNLTKRFGHNLAVDHLSLDIHEGEIYYVRVPEAHAKTLLTKFQDRLTPEELEALNKFIEIMRVESPFWAA